MRIRPRLLALVVALAAASLVAEGQSPRRRSGLLAVQAAPGGAGSMSVTFVQIGAPLTQVGGGLATMDLGPVSYFGVVAPPGVTLTRLPGALQISTLFGVRVDRKGGAQKTATVSAFLPAAGTTTVSIDGVPLTGANQVISSSVNFGVTLNHTLTLGVPTSAPSGPLSVTVGVMAVAN